MPKSAKTLSSDNVRETKVDDTHSSLKLDLDRFSGNRSILPDIESKVILKDLKNISGSIKHKSKEGSVAVDNLTKPNLKTIQEAYSKASAKDKSQRSNEDNGTMKGKEKGLDSKNASYNQKKIVHQKLVSQYDSEDSDSDSDSSDVQVTASFCFTCSGWFQHFKIF